MKLIAGPLVLLICAAGMTAYMVRKNGIERDKAVHEAAIADSEEINRGIKLYYERKNKPLRLHNDLLRLKNDQLDYEIAQLQGRRATRSKIQADLAIIDNDKEALRLMDTDSPALEPHQAEIRIQEHNRKYPKDQIASIADFNGEMDKFQEQIDRVLEDTNRKLREVK